MYTYYVNNINNIVFSIFLNWHNIIYIIDGKYWHINHLILCDTFKNSEFASVSNKLNYDRMHRIGEKNPFEYR